MSNDEILIDDDILEGDEESHGYADYTTEELLEQAQANAQATLMATARFLHRKRIPLSEWAEALGETFAMAWQDHDEDWEAGEFMDAMLTNFRALGATVVSADLGEDSAKAVITGFPDPEMAELFSIDIAHTAVYADAAKVIATQRGLVWDWKRRGTRLTLTATRAEVE